MKYMLVDDHSLFIEGLSYLLQTYGFEVSCIAYSGKEAMNKARQNNPDVILMDISMPYLSGIDTLKLIKAEKPEIKIVMLTSSESDEDLYEAIRYGASGYLLKSTKANELVELLHSIEQGEAQLTPAIAAKILREKISRRDINNISSNQNEYESPQLTDRQIEILKMVAEGITYKEVATSLGLTERTIKYHMEHIITTLHLENRSQVIAYAVKMGIVNHIQANEI